jgi:hypothetical protein
VKDTNPTAVVPDNFKNPLLDFVNGCTGVGKEWFHLPQFLSRVPAYHEPIDKKRKRDTSETEVQAKRRRTNEGPTELPEPDLADVGKSGECPPVFETDIICSGQVLEQSAESVDSPRSQEELDLFDLPSPIQSTEFISPVGTFPNISFKF